MGDGVVSVWNATTSHVTRAGLCAYGSNPGERKRGVLGEGPSGCSGVVCHLLNCTRLRHGSGGGGGGVTITENRQLLEEEGAILIMADVVEDSFDQLVRRLFCAYPKNGENVADGPRLASTVAGKGLYFWLRTTRPLSGLPLPITSATPWKPGRGCPPAGGKMSSWLFRRGSGQRPCSWQPGP